MDFLNQLQDDALLEVHTEKEIPEEPFEILGLSDSATHGIHALDVIRESGQIAIDAGETMTFTVTKFEGVTRSEANGILREHSTARRLSTIAFSILRHQLQIRVQPLEPRIFVHQTDCFFGEDEIQSQSAAQL